MTYFLMDKDGYLGDVGTSAGVMELSKHAGAARFVETGETVYLGALAESLRECGLAELADKVKDAKPPVILTDGVVDEEEEEQKVAKGDVPGHEFHGNQWTEGEEVSFADEHGTRFRIKPDPHYPETHTHIEVERRGRVYAISWAGTPTKDEVLNEWRTNRASFRPYNTGSQSYI